MVFCEARELIRALPARQVRFHLQQCPAGHSGDGDAGEARRGSQAAYAVGCGSAGCSSRPGGNFQLAAGALGDRGVSLDTNIFLDFSIEQALRDLKNRGVLREGQVARVAVIGPGLDVIDKNERSSYDYYPQQTLQPFALYDSLVRLGLARAGGLSMSIFDISSRVIDHMQRARKLARMNTGYVIQLPRQVADPWPADLIAYWRSLGDRVGAEVASIRPPEGFLSVDGGQTAGGGQTANGGPGLETRAVRIRPDVVLRCQPVNLNIVLERMPLAEADRFDLDGGYQRLYLL